MTCRCVDTVNRCFTILLLRMDRGEWRGYVLALGLRCEFDERLLVNFSCRIIFIFYVQCFDASLLYCLRG